MRALDKLRTKLGSLRIDGFLISASANVRYISGFEGAEAFLVITPRRAFLITDSRYTEQAETETEGFEIVERQESLLKTSAEFCQKLGLKKLGVESSHTSISALRELEKSFAGEIVELEGVVEELRAIKSPEEISKIRRAVETAESAFKEFRKELQLCRTELEAVGLLEYLLRKYGGWKPSFETIVVAGAHCSQPHARPTEAPITRRSVLLVDWGAVCEGYCSDTTRMLLGEGIDEEVARGYNVVLEANEKARSKVKPGVKASEVDACAREVIKQAGYAEAFLHGTGHGVGREIHEAPSLSTRSEQVLEEGMVLTIEPAIYIKGKWGIRIEDIGVVTAERFEHLGCLPHTLDEFTEEWL